MKLQKSAGLKFRREHKKKQKYVMAAAGVLAVLCLFAGLKMTSVPKVLLKVNPVTILQDEELPKVKASAVCVNKKKPKKKIEKGYTLGQFLEELNAGKGYKLKYKADNTKEGTYPVQIVMDKALEKKLSQKWRGKVKFSVEEGVVTVRNKYGTWDGSKFKKLDGTYVVSDFIVSKGEEYFFDENGEMCTGERIIADQKCVFGKDGKLISRERYLNPDMPMVALTFDDGPGKYTETLLQALEKHDARATFLMLGSRVGQYPNALKKMEEIGCELGNHSWDHANLVKLDETGIRAEIEQTNQAIEAVVGHGASIVRPPYGSFNATVRGVAGLPIVLWSVDTLDWKRKDAAQITEYVMNTVSDGDIILMHDIHDFSVNSAIELIPKLKEKGFQLVTVSEMAKARGVTLKPGVKYFRFYKE